MLAREQAQAEVSQRNVAAQAMRVRDLQAQQESRRRDSQQKTTRAAQLDQLQHEAESVAAAQRGTAHELGASIAVLASQIDPAEARVAELERGQRAAEAEEQEARERVRLAGMRQSQAELAKQRAEDNLQHLRREIEKDLGLVILAGEEGEDDQPPLPLNGVVTRLSEVDELPENLERDVRELRAQIGRLGPVNLEAPAEYAELEARHTFLTTQSADLEQAVARLMDVIAELDRVMERDFVVTFKAVAAEFREQFKKLFGGGSARLVLSDPENPGLSGIEIYARPPGKREQGLPLLSGGERALTAAALIFSILKVRPTPFCVLDEVDAALDEANVGRFRDALRDLSELTQFILITHNRGTIEAADTIYGISMGTDNTSQVLSLKLEGHVVEQPETPLVIG